jgi:hypothetical protein
MHYAIELTGISGATFSKPLMANSGMLAQFLLSEQGIECS